MSDKEKDLMLLLVVFAVLIALLPTLMWGLWSGGHMHGMGGAAGYGWGLMSLIPFAFLVLLALGAYFLLKEFMGRDESESALSRGERALEILKERYARGEITREQYVKMKEELET